jgi:hypothetical protein
VSHADAALTPRARLRLARLIVEQNWPVAQAAQRFQVSWPTANRWAQRYRAEGEAGMYDRSSRPHHSPRKTPAPMRRKIVHLRWKQRLGPVEIAARAGCAPSTAHQVLVRCRINRLAHLDRVTGEAAPLEHPTPGDLLRVDVRKLGNIPDGGGRRFVGRAQGKRHRAATATRRWAPCSCNRARRPLPSRLHRDPRRRDHRGRGPDPGGGLVRRPRRARRAGAVGQRLGPPLAPVARHLHPAGHHP